MIEIDQALLDKHLLGAALGPADTWSTWLTTLRAAFALPLDRKDKITFAKISGDRTIPSKPCRELWAIAGRGSGKSRTAAAVSVYTACFLDRKPKLAPGETGFVLTLSPSLDQSKIIFRLLLRLLKREPHPAPTGH